MNNKHSNTDYHGFSNKDYHGTGKPCPKCTAPMISLSGTTGSRLCSNGKCKHEEEWKLDEGQKYLHINGDSRMNA